MSLRDAAQLALEALEEHRTVRLHDNDYLGVCAWCYVDSCDPCDERCTSNNAITALRAALAEETMQRLTDVQQEMERQDGTGKTSDHIADANKMVPTINGMETVEPVAYVTGYRDGFCVISPVEPVVFPTGMALYMSPPNQSEDALGMVEPVAYCTLEQLAHLKLTVPSEDKIAIYTAQPKRKPLTDEEMGVALGMVEPVAWAVITKGRKLYKAASTKESAERKAAQQIDKLGVEWECSVVPLYLAAPKREPLTDEELYALGAESHEDIAFVRRVLAAHGIGGEE